MRYNLISVRMVSSKRKISIDVERAYIMSHPLANILNRENFEATSLKSRMREGCSLSPFLFNKLKVYKVLTRVLRWEKETKGIQISLFADSLILYIR